MALGVLVIEDAGEDFDLIGFLALGRKPALAGAALVKEFLDIRFLKRDKGRTAINHAADGRPVALAKRRHSKKMAKAIVGHETGLYHSTRLRADYGLRDAWRTA